MRRRYDMERSDNYMYTGRMLSRVCGDGIIFVNTGFPVTSATVSFATVPISDIERWSSSSSSSLSSISSSSSSVESLSSSSTSSESAGNVSTSSASESSSSSDALLATLPRIYVSGYASTGFYVAYENISCDIGYIEFNYACV